MAESPSDSNYVWIYPEDKKDWMDEIVKEFHIHPVSAQVLVSRGFQSLSDIHHFLYSQLPDLHDPYLLNDMPAAVKRICDAIEKGEGILIYGDNDVDGMTGTALLTEFLRFIGARVEFYLTNPGVHRKNLIVEAIETAKDKDCTLMITVDCGVTAAAEIEQVIQHNIDVIVTDHHEPTDRIPHCVATLNPKLLNSTYPNRDITGVGVAFKLAHGISSHLIAEGNPVGKEVVLKDYLDLVALGTISDMGALVGENRILVRYGLQELKQTKRAGLRELFSVSGVNTSTLATTDIASKIAPRLNSLGRIDVPQKGVDILLMRDTSMAEVMAQELDENNIERQRIERHMSLEVEEYIEKHPEILKHRALILSGENWHSGVIAIVATRISKQFNRPAIVLAVQDGVGKGSLRSIPEFPLLQPLKDLSRYLINFGGHDFAAGLTIPTEHLKEFSEHFIAAADAQLSDHDVQCKLKLDAPVEFRDLTFEFMESLHLLEPYGNENPPPVLYADAVQAWPPKVVGKSHLKVYLEQDGWMLEGIGFGMGERIDELRSKKRAKVRAAFTPQVNNFQNKASIQLLLKDFTIIS